MQQAVVTRSCSLIPALDPCAYESGTSAIHQGTDFVAVVLFPACRIVCPSLLCKGNRTAAEATVSIGHRAPSWVGQLREAGGRLCKSGAAVPVASGGYTQLSPAYGREVVLCKGVLSGSQQTQAAFPSSCPGFFFFFPYHSHKSSSEITV